MVKLWIYFIVGFIVGKFALKAICFMRDVIFKFIRRKLIVITLDDAEYGGDIMIGVASNNKQKWKMLKEAFDCYELFFDDKGVLTRKSKDFIPYGVRFNITYVNVNRFDGSYWETTIGYEDEWKKPD